MSETSKCIAIIPARGGSKRIPQKNIRVFLGKPIIAYAIETSIQSSLFDRVVVSTDSAEIAEVARKFGAEVPFIRPVEISNDYASTADVLVHALETLSTKEEYYRFACCIYPTAVLMSPKDLHTGYELISSGKADTVFSIARYTSPIFRALKVNHVGKIEMFWPENELVRSNDLPESYHDAGQFYWLRVERFLKKKKLYSGNAMPVILPAHRVQDIDTEDDWQMAEHKYRTMMQVVMNHGWENSDNESQD